MFRFCVILKMSNFFCAMHERGCKSFNPDSVAWLGMLPWSQFFLLYNLVERWVFLSANRNRSCFCGLEAVWEDLA